LEWIDPPFCSGHWGPELVEIAGDEEPLGQKGMDSRRIGWEAVLAAQPEVLVLACCGYPVERTLQDLPILQSYPGWKALPAVRGGRVFAVDGSAYFSRPGPRVVDSLEILATILHPERFAGCFPDHGVKQLRFHVFEADPISGRSGRLLQEPVARIVVRGSDTQAGSYLLRMRVSEDLSLSFGRFNRGKEIAVPAGEYVYVGSALAAKGGVSLGRRLVRHATRSGTKPPHAIRAAMLELFQTIRLGSGDLRPRGGKRLFWNVDHLLDHEVVEIAGIFVLRSELRLEREMGQLLEQEPCTRVIERGLGANDVPGNTHLLRVDADESWWLSLPEKLQCLLLPERLSLD
jgi:Uri superfamily endonuclease